MLWMDSREDRASMQKKVPLRVTNVTNHIRLRKTPDLGKAGRVVLGNTIYACPVFTPPKHRPMNAVGHRTKEEMDHCTEPIWSFLRSYILAYKHLFSLQ